MIIEPIKKNKLEIHKETRVFYDKSWDCGGLSECQDERIGGDNQSTEKAEKKWCKRKSGGESQNCLNLFILK